MLAKGLAGSLVFTFVVATSAFSLWIRALITDLVRESDLAVVATLTDVDQYTADGTDYAEGVLTVEEVVFGKPLRDPLTLRWRNPTNRACPRVEHEYLVGKRALWLLTVEESGDVKADHPSRVVPFRPRSLEMALAELAEYGTSPDVRIETLRKLLREEAADQADRGAVQQ